MTLADSVIPGDFSYDPGRSDTSKDDLLPHETPRQTGLSGFQPIRTRVEKHPRIDTQIGGKAQRPNHG